MNPFEIRTLEAFLRALSQAGAPLSRDLQNEIRRLGLALEKHDFSLIREVPNLVKQDPALDEQYKSVYRSLQMQYQAQERAKSLTLTVSNSTSFDLVGSIAQVCSSDNIADAAGQFISRLESVIEDIEDLAVVAERREEPTISHDLLIAELQADGFI